MSDPQTAATRCCEANVPRLNMYRSDGDEWTCWTCGKTWVWEEDEAEGGAFWPMVGQAPSGSHPHPGSDG